MKKLTIILLSAICYLLSIQTALAWHISSYDTNIEVQPNSTLVITETITADFTADPHHGLVRTIPKDITKEDGHTERLRFQLQSITDESGEKLSYTRSDTFDSIQYKIGNADIYVEDERTYVITYEVSNGLSYFDSHNEVYWNVIGPAWETSIWSASATVKLPETLSITDELGTTCYTGAYGSTDQDCEAQEISYNQVNFGITDPLSPYEAFTIAVSFPLGHTTAPTEEMWLIYDYWPIAIIPFAFLFLFWKWKNFGKDRRNKTIIPQYAPPKNISPIEASILLDDKADPRDISAIIIDLAIRGFIKIEEIEFEKFGFFKAKDYMLHRINIDAESSLQTFEKMLLNKIFEDKLEKKVLSLRNNFYQHIKKLQDEMYIAVTEKKLFEKHPDKAKERYVITSIIITFSGFVSFPLFAYFHWGIPLAFSLVIIGILTMVFGLYMPKKTDSGQELYEQVLGLKMYIETAEKDRIKFHEKRNHFEALLPYAMIFNQTKHWSKQFQDIYKEPPNWYDSKSWGATSAFSLKEFTHNLENATDSISGNLSSKPGSGGSGFSGGSSGGGGGGGGGGAW